MVIRNAAGILQPVLTEVGIRNFKAFGDSVQSAPMSRITLLYGPNSGGKSSIIQALLLLKQSEGNLPRGAALAPQGEYVDLAGFRAMAHRHDESREVEINVKLKNANGRAPVDVNIDMTFGHDKQHRPDLPILHKVGYEVKYTDTDDLAMQLRLVRANSVQSDEPASFRWADEESSARSYVNYLSALRHRAFEPRSRRTSSIRPNELDDLTDEKTSVLRHFIFQARSSVLPFVPSLDETGQSNRERGEQQFRTWERKLMERDHESRELEVGLETGHRSARFREFNRRGRNPNDLVQELKAQGVDPARRLEELQEQVREIREQEPEGLRELREFTDHLLTHPFGMEQISRSYQLFIEGMSYLGPILDDPRRFYPSWGGRRSTVGKRGEYTVDIISYDDGVLNTVNEWFARFGIPYKIVDVRNVADSEFTGTLSAMVLEDTRTGTIVTPVDVGFGISQILPVIVEGVAGDCAIMCVDQPEVHLHPKLQAEIADLMVECQGKQWIVETHSELLVRRILTRIAEGKIKSTDVSVLYVDPPKIPDAGKGSTIEVLDIEENGRFSSSTPWPDGFFEDGYREMMTAIRAGG